MSVNLRDVFQLLETRSAHWYDIGRELCVSLNYREIVRMEGVMSTNLDKLERVLYEWIESECSPVNWSTIRKLLVRLEWNDELQKLEEFVQIKGKSSFITQVFQLLEPVASHWMNIGRHLCVDREYRVSVSKDSTISSDAGRLMKVLVKWEESECSLVSWNTVVDVVEKMEFGDLIPKARAHLPNMKRVTLGDVFQLLKTRSFDWDAIGRELRVPFHYRRSVLREGVMSTDLDKLESVLYKWMESECSPVNWSTIRWLLVNLEWNDKIQQLGEFLKTKDDESEDSVEEHRLMKLAKEGLINGRSVKLRALKGILIGGPGVGKTITFNRLTNRRGNIEKDGHSRSTGVEKPDTVHLYRDVEKASVLIGKRWLPQALEGQLSTYLHCLQHQNPHNTTVPSVKVKIPTTSTLATPGEVPAEPRTPSNDSNPFTTTTSSDQPKPKEQPQSREDEHPPHQSSIDVKKISSLLQLGKLEDVEKMIEEIGEITVLYMMDLGGQPEYFEILPLLLHGPFLGIIFINLALSLTEPFKVTYRHTESTHSTISYTASYCQIDIVHQVLALIDALSPDHAPQSSTIMRLKSHACLIGTHKDAPSVSSNTISAFEKEIKESLKPCKELYHLLSMLYQHDGKANFIFPIDNFHGDETEIEGLRKALTDQIYDKFESEEINIRWGIFHLLLRSEYEKPGFCGLPDAVKLGIACGLQNEYKVIDALKYIHFRFGTILYYHKVASLSDRVICDPNLIFRPLTQIIADSFGADPQTAEEIRETGIVPLETFHKACKKDGPEQRNALSIKDLVDLLKYHNILSEVTQDGESVLFMPCLLQPYSAASDDDHQQSKDDYLNAFLFTFSPYGFQPIGLFYALTAKLLSLDDFELASVRFRDKISFLFGDACIELSSMFRFLEVRVDGCSPARRVCLLSILHEQIDSIMKDLPHTKSIEAEVSLYCPVSIDKSTPHIAELHHVKQMAVSEKSKVLKCKNCRKGFMKRVELTKEQEMWFEDPSIASEKTLKDPVKALKAFQLTKSHSSHWEDVGRSLGLSQNDRDVIKQERVTVNGRLEAVLNQWIETQGAPRWITLVNALKEEGFISLAENIQRKCCL